MSSFSTKDISFTDVADLYLSELRKGIPLSIEVLAKTFPHLDEEIRTSLPAMALLEQSFEQSKSASPATPGDTIGGCEIVRELGRGAMGVVYEARQNDLDRNVAIKVIPANHGNRQALKRFVYEAKALGRLEHPHITTVYASGFEETRAYLVMRLIDGSSLRDLLDGHCDYKMQFQINELRHDWNVFARAAADLASALQHAHERELVHRDIKPANLLLDRTGKVWITDFGLAKLLDTSRDLSATGDAIGTLRYMSPEQLHGLSDARSDIYALGITLYEIAVGTHPWADRSINSIISQREELSIASLAEQCSSMSPNLAKILMKCCAFAPEQRYQSALELRVVLDRFLEGKPQSDRRVRLREPDQIFQQKSRRRLILAGSSVAAVSILAGGSLALLSTPAAPQTAPQTAQSSTPEVFPSSVRLLDELANTEKDDMLEIVADYVGESIQQTSEELHYSENAKSEIRDQVDKLTTRIKSDGAISDKSLNEFLREYRKSSLPAATRVMRLTVVIEQSQLRPQEQQAAILLLQRLATAVANQAISADESEAISRSLLGGNPTAELLQNVWVPEQHLRSWLWHLNTRLAQVPADAFNLSNALNAELGSAYNAAFESTATSKRPAE